MKQERTYKIIGATALVMHNGQLANPFNPYTKLMKKISSKRDKTEADFEELAKLEWFGGLYLSRGVPCIPGEILEATLVNAAKKKKKGPQTKAGLLCPLNAPLIYPGPQNLDALWECEEYRYMVGVIISRSRIMRMRPIFPEWSAEISITFNDELLNPGDVTEMLHTAGDIIGLMDRRPKFGRFTVV